MFGYNWVGCGGEENLDLWRNKTKKGWAQCDINRGKLFHIIF